MLDFDEEWKRQQARRPQPDDALGWNKRAPRYDSRDARNLYAEEFIARAGIAPGETAFDMGCGTGSLAVPLAEAGHRVIAADFSEGMLAKLKENARIHGVEALELDKVEADGDRDDGAPERGRIEALHMSWEDDWSAFGLADGMADVAIASRSIAVADLRAALYKLNRIARRRCCITMATGTSPRVDPAVLADIGVPASPSRDFVYAFGLLAQAGFEPDVSYIHSSRTDTFPDRETAFDDFSRMVAIGADAAFLADEEAMRAARERLSAWLDAHLADNPNAGMPDKKGVPQGALMLDFTRTVSWAFLSWNPHAATL